MTTEYRIAQATPDTAALAARTLRPQDLLEIAAYSEKNPIDVVMSSYEGSRDTWVGLADDVPICLFGVWSPSLLTTVGHPWMYGSRLMKGHERAFLRRCRPVVAAMASRYGELRNWVDVRNTPAIQWLRWLGFEVSDEIVRFPRLPGKFHPYRYGSKS